MQRRPARIGLVTLYACLAGCTVGPNFRPPQPTDAQAPAYRRLQPASAAVSAAADPDPQWWTAFNDPLLDKLIGLALEGNLGLKQAVLRVVQARQNIATARAAGLPTLSGAGSYTHQQLGLKGILESKGVYDQLNRLADQAAPDMRSSITGALDPLTQPVDLYQYSLNVSWELDLFGRVRRSVEQAKANAEAQAEATNASLIMLQGDVAQTYMQLRGAQALAGNQRDNIKADESALDLTRRRALQGLATSLDTDQARTQLLNDQRLLPAYDKQAQQAMDQLAVLTGRAPGLLDTMLAPPDRLAVPVPPLVVPIGVPSTLARRRPDIREAEASLHAATAGVGVAVANFYPDISLTGSLGLRATDASYLTNWASHFYSVGPSISLPIFQGGRLEAGLRMARAQQASAALQYRATVLNALREVEDALVAYRTDREARDLLAQTVASAADAEYLAGSRYRNGLADFIQVLDARRTLVSARLELVQAEMGLAVDVVALYRALGGGWQTGASAKTPPPLGAVPPPLPAAADALIP